MVTTNSIRQRIDLLDRNRSCFLPVEIRLLLDVEIALLNEIATRFEAEDIRVVENASALMERMPAKRKAKIVAAAHRQAKRAR